MGPEGIILVNFPITTFQQSLTHSALEQQVEATCGNTGMGPFLWFLLKSTCASFKPKQDVSICWAVLKVYSRQLALWYT